MTTTDTRNIQATVDQVRAAVPAQQCPTPRGPVGSACRVPSGAQQLQLQPGGSTHQRQRAAPRPSNSNPGSTEAGLGWRWWSCCCNCCDCLGACYPCPSHVAAPALKTESSQQQHVRQSGCIATCQPAADPAWVTQAAAQAALSSQRSGAVHRAWHPSSCGHCSSSLPTPSCCCLCVVI